MTTKPEESPKGTMLHRNPRFHTCENPQGKLTPAMAAGILALGAGFAVGHFQAVRERATSARRAPVMGVRQLPRAAYL
jgi:hypothetical protein